MKEKFWGLKKDEVDRVIRRKEREFQFELQRLEFELITLKKENDSLNEQIIQEEKKQISLSINDPYWQLANTRIKTILSMLNSQKESEMTILTESSNEKRAKLQIEILQLDEEIQSINQTIDQFLTQLDNKKNQDCQLIEEVVEEKIENVEEVSHDNTKEGILQDSVDTSDRMEWLQSEVNDPIQMSTNILLKHDEDNPIKQEKEPDLIDTEILTSKDRLIEQISSFKEQYIIGKVAGADLFDQSGKLIAPVNTKITKEIVEKANINGKLAELIVNMKVLMAGEE